MSYEYGKGGAKATTPEVEKGTKVDYKEPTNPVTPMPKK